ncbi:hypothetical protein STVA_22550 [Allostella vacuolata]|nr:hypothetical protein STVA_22550 [Stella vacuolata]
MQRPLGSFLEIRNHRVIIAIGRNTEPGRGMVEPITLGVMAMAALSGLVGNRADALACKATRKVQAVFLSGLREPRNLDLARATRRSQLLALKLTVRAYEQLPQPHWRSTRTHSAEDMATRLSQWIQQGIAWDATLEADLGALGTIDEAAWAKRLGAIEGRIERVFVHPEPHEGSFLARQEELRALVEGWTLEEAAAQVANRSDWERFATLFRGGEVEGVRFSGWWPLFRAFMAEEVKRDAKVQAILTQQGIARLLELQEDLKVAVASLQAGFERLMEEVGQQLDALRAVADRVENSAEAIEGILTRIENGFLARLERMVLELPDAVGERVRAELGLLYGITVDTGFKELEGRRVRQLPTELLIARYGVVDYLDRGGVLADLLAWARDPNEPAPRGRLYVAAGGFGKTRLAIEAIRRLGPEWRATFLSSGNAGTGPDGALRDLISDREGRSVFLVLDYAEAQLDLLRRIAHATSVGRTRLRVLAMARSSEGWWDSARSDSAVGTLFDAIPRRELESGLSPEERTLLFERAVQNFRTTLERFGVPTVAAPLSNQDLGQAVFDRPLGIAMAAYLAVNGAGASDKSLLERMLIEERRHWKRALAPNDHAAMGDRDSRLISLHRLMAQMTLVQGATVDAADTLIVADPRGRQISLGERESTLDVAERLYGRTWKDPVSGRIISFINPIEPDLMGEHIAMAALASDRTGLAAATLSAALAGPHFNDSHGGALLTVLVRAQRAEHDGSTREAALDALRSLDAAAGQLSGEAARRLGSHFQDFSVPLMRLSVSVARRVLETAESEEETAGASSFLALSLSETGEAQAALEPSRRAVEIREKLASAEPARFLPDLARSLNNHASCLSETGDARAALEPSLRALEIREKLASAEPARFLPDLAASLNSHAGYLSEAGDARAALEPSRRAVEIREKLASAEPSRFLPDLATSLSNHALLLSETGEARAAQEPSRRAVEINEKLALSEPARFLPDLAVSLTNHALFLGQTGEAQAALEPSRRAVEINEKLASSEPSRFLRDLARSLNNHASYLSETGEAQAALEPSRRAVEINEKLASSEPSRFLRDLARSLHNHAIRLSETGEAQAALEPSRRAVEIYERLASSEPSRFLPDLARSLTNHAIRLSEMGDARAGLEPSRQAVEIYERLASAEPARFLPYLAVSLNNHAMFLSATGEVRAGLEPSRRAVEIYERLASAEPARFLPYLAVGLNNHAMFLSETGDARAGLEPSRRAVEIYERLASAEPARFLPDLARSRGTYGQVLHANGLIAAAAEAFEAGIVAILPLEIDMQAVYGGLLHALASDLIQVLVEMGRTPDEIVERLTALGLDSAEVWPEQERP